MIIFAYAYLFGFPLQNKEVERQLKRYTQSEVID